MAIVVEVGFWIDAFLSPDPEISDVEKHEKKVQGQQSDRESQNQQHAEWWPNGTQALLVVPVQFSDALVDVGFFCRIFRIHAESPCCSNKG